jgi:signal transduction histidine kinase/CheY-like chemotaxis protein
MSGEPADLDPPGVRPSLPELLRALDAIRDRLTRLERAAGAPSPSAGVGIPAAGGADAPALAIVQDILSIPSMGLDPGELFTLAMDRASRLLSADRTMLFVAEPGGGRLVPRSAHGFRREDLPSISVRPGEGMVGAVFRQRRVLIHPPIGEESTPDSFIERFPVQVAIAVPVRAEDEVAGVLYAGRRRLDVPFSASEILLLLLIADRVAGGLAHQTLLDRRAGHLARLGALRAFGAETVAAFPLRDVLAHACEVGCRLAGVRAAAIALADASGELDLAAARGLPGAMEAWRRVDPRDGLTAELDAGGAPVTSRDVQARDVPERSFLGDGGFHGCLLLPLTSRSVRLGVLYLADTEVRDFSTEEIEAARVLATMTAAVIDGSRSRDEREDALGRTRSAHERLIEVEKARAVGELAAGLARELGSIFALVLGKTRLMLPRAHDEASREGLGLLEEAAWRGADVVDRLTALAGPGSGEAVRLVDVTTLLHDVLAVARPQGPGTPEEAASRIDIVTDLRAAPPVRGDATTLRDALVNVVRNSLDAMPHGGRIAIATRPRDAGVEIILEDTGEGIPEDARRRVFDPFYTTRPATRMGLGLTVAHGAITRHGGRIEVSGASGGGTRVMIWLPGGDTSAVKAGQTGAGATIVAPRQSAALGRTATDLRDGAEGAREPGPAAPLPAGAGRASEATRGQPHATAALGPGGQMASILVIEDEATVRSLLITALTNAGYGVETAMDGPSGLAKLETGRFDVVLTDLALPQGSGLAIAGSVKRLHPRTPVVLITGWGHVLDPERLREQGVDLMLVKPFRLERVLSVVSDALRLLASA